MQLNDALFNKDEREYGEQYKTHYLDLYNSYVATTLEISKKRQNAHTFFLSINAAIIGYINYIQVNLSTEFFFPLINLVGIVICCIWYALIKSYREMNKAKFKVILELEKKLPISVYTYEWELIKPGSEFTSHKSFSDTEIKIPLTFFILHCAVFLAVVVYHFL